jgi:hypothetical protein
VPPSTITEHTSFTVAVATDRGLDLTREPFASPEAEWTHPHDYAACQDRGAAAREAGLAVFRTISGRDAERGCNTVILDPAAFAAARPAIRRTWHPRLESGRLTALAAFPAEDRYVCTAEDFGPV